MKRKKEVEHVEKRLADAVAERNRVFRELVKDRFPANDAIAALINEAAGKKGQKQ